MFRPKNSSDAPRQSRHSLEAWNRTPTLDDVRMMMEEATAKRGVLIDVPIRRDRPPVFVLTCQWESTSQDPVWSLYEGEDGSKVCWTYPNGNLDMIYEIICMTLPGGVKNSTPSTLGTGGHAPGTTTPAADSGFNDVSGHPGLSSNPAPGQGMPGAPPQGVPYGQPGQPMQPGQPGQPMQPGQPLPPPQGYPQQPAYPPPMPGAPGYPPGYPQQQQPYPPQGQPAGYPPGYPPPQGPPGYPQGYPPPQGYPQGYPPPQGYPQQAPGYPQQPPGYPQPNPYPNALPPQYQQQPQAPAQAPAQPAELHSFIDLLNKGQNQMMLGHLFIESGVLPEPCVEAALKLQELVRKGLLSNSAAIEALRKSAESGGTLDDEIIGACRSKYPSDSLNQSVPVYKPPSLDPREFNRQVILLIQQSGIVTENDVITAEGVRKKHGGDVGTILVAAGKIERATFDAAKRCQPLVQEHRLNHEEAYRILRHCQKNKSTVDDAFRALSIQVL